MGSAQSFAHLHVHTQYSLLDGAAQLGPLAQAAARMGMPALAMTDHGNMHGAYDFHRKVTAAGVKPIIGIEAYIAPEGRRHDKPVFWGAPHQRSSNDATGEGGDVSGGGAYLHMTMLAETADGLHNLFRLSTLASKEGFHRKPRMDKEIISQYGDGIIATTGCPSGEVQTRLRLGQFDQAVQAAADWREIFGAGNYFLEVMDHGLPIERRVRDELMEIGRRLNLPIIATNDSHYVEQGDADAHDSLLCVGTGSQKADTDRFRFDGDGYYLKTAEEMRALWDGEVPGACDNTLLIAERVQDYAPVFAHRKLLPEFKVPDGHTQSTWLREQTRLGMRARFGDAPDAAVLDRAEFELGVIEQMGFEAYFLVVADICAYARNNGIAVGPGRGSATGSMVAYALRITELNPIEHGLLFERFLNPDRVSMPDIDLDFDERRRGDVIRYIAETYGDDHCSMIVTFGTIKAKAAVKDAARILGFPIALAEKISRTFPAAAQGNEIPLTAIFDDGHPRYAEAAPLRELYKSNVDVRQIVDAARPMEGATRSTGVHAAGIILSAQPLIDVVPLTKRESDGAIICGFPYQQAEELGLLKMDCLGLRNLTVLSDCVHAVRDRLGEDVDLLALPLDDARTYELLARGETLGIFQLDGSGTRALLSMVRPDAFNDIAATLALYRPGPMGANSHTNYALRKNGQQEIIPIHPELADPLADVLDETYGLIVYQEQVMAIAQKVAGFSLAQADLLRRAMGKKKKAELDKQFEAFKKGMNDSGYSDSAVTALWDILLPFSDYAFNKSHTAGYGLVSYWTAYLKANYPADYMAALLSSVGDDKAKSAIYLSECRRMGLKVLSPDVNESTLRYTAVDDGAIRFGLGAVRNVGENVVASIVDARRGKPYASFPDFLDRIDPRACNKRTVESLVKAGAFDSLGHARKGLYMVFERAVEAASSAKKVAAHGQDSLFGDEDAALTLTVPNEEWDLRFRLSVEREMLGLYVSDHPLRGTESLLAKHRTAAVDDILLSEQDEASVTICGLVTHVDRRVSKAGNPWGIITIEDLTASIEVTFFGKTYELFEPLLAEDVVAEVAGKVKMQEGSTSLLGNDFHPIDLATATMGRPPVVLSLSEPALTLNLVRRLRDVLRAHPGETPVRVRLRPAAGESILMVLPDYSVEPSTAFASEMKALFGASSLPD